MSVTVYGISNCDTVKKARTWLTERSVDHRFHDFRKDGLDAALLADFVTEAGWETLLNRAGTTFRKLAESERTDLDSAKATKIMLAQPATIKRPVVTGAGAIIVGFKPDVWASRFE